MSKDAKLRTRFRPIPEVQDIHQVENRDPAYRYKNVIMTYKTDPNRVQRYLRSGWEIVETTEPNRDDRLFTPNSKEEKLRPQMCVETTSDGHDQILMRILWTLDAQNGTDRKKENDLKLSKESQKRGEKIVKRGNTVITTGAELN